MSFTKLVFRSIWFYRKLNLTVILGVALSTAILLGALIIGDSVKFGLEQITIKRLGQTSQVITGSERLFRKQLAEDLADKTGIKTSAMLRSNGIGVIDGGKSQFNQLAVWGVDSTLGYFSNHSNSFVLNGNEAAINDNLAKISGLKVGDELLLRVNKLNTFPANTPFVSASEASISFRILVTKILKTDELGNFSLQNIQSSPRNVFLNLQWLNDQMKLHQKANVILVAEGITLPELTTSLQQNWNMGDLNLKIQENDTLNYTEIKSDRVFIEPTIEQFCTDRIPGSFPIFSYFVNDFSINGNHTPYSFVSTSDTLTGRQILVSDWLANDLMLHPNDTVRLSYFEVGPLRKLVQKDTTFIVERIYTLEGELADPNLMPDIPGLSDVGNCRDWKTGVPVDLKKIRPKDEKYWKQYKGIPKAFVSLQMAKQLWGNRFGQSTAIRVAKTRGKELEHAILNGILPSQAGYEIKSSKSEGLAASANGVDFGQLFIGLSFFVLIAAFLLAYLLYKLFLGYRTSEIKIYTALGFTLPIIRKLFFAEATFLVIIGIFIGIPVAFMYDFLVLKAINTVWNDIVRTTIAQIYVQPSTIFIAFVSISAISLFTYFVILNRFLKKQRINFERRRIKKDENRSSRTLLTGIFFVVFSSIILFFSRLVSGEVNTELFYISGFGLLPGLIFLLDFLLRRLALIESSRAFSVQSFILKRLSGERKRTLLSVSFLSIGIFLVVSTGLFRKEISLHPEQASSGTGGYNYFIETTLPILFDPTSTQAKSELGLSPDAQIAAFHVQSGDDASCLNLNRVSRPRIIGCNPSQFNVRKSFTFITHTKELDENHPWNSLNVKLPDNVIPAFADQTVIQWGLGKSIGDTLLYKNEEGETVKLKLIGGLENSIFQGNVIIAEDYFVKAFPSVSGANLFLIQAPNIPINNKDFREGWRPYGAEITGTTDRLLTFNQIENTYLNIFLLLGGLGLLIGTIGLGILIFRTTIEQMPEYGLMQSIGFNKSQIFSMLYAEKLYLLVAAVIIGAVPATISGLPILLSSTYSDLWFWLPAVSMLVLVSGSVFSLLAVQLALKNNPIASLRGE